MTSLGKYELHEQLGRGGFGTVYRAMDISLKREAALKILHPQLTADPDFLRLFRNEARLVASLHSPQIVTIYELAEADGRVFIAMEYLPGGSLEQKLEKSGAIPFPITLKAMQDICTGLQEAHEQGLVHRDIKPANILFDKKGRAVIGDFGLARAIQLSSSSAASSAAGGAGTPAYRAPELWNGKPPASPATDVYSLGCVLYEMVTGKALFHGSTPVEIITQHLVQGPRLPEKFPDGTPPIIRMILEKCLAKDPLSRYQSAIELSKALEEAGGGSTREEVKVGDPRDEKAPSPYQALLEKIRKLDGGAAFIDFPWKTVGIVLGTIAVVLLGGWLSVKALLANASPAGSKTPSEPAVTQAAAFPELPTAAPEPTAAPSPGPTPRAGSIRVSEIDGMEMVYVPAGEFLMGSPDWIGDEDERPQHAVYLDSFWIDRTEVTNGMYRRCADAGICPHPEETSSNTRASYFGNSEFSDYPVIYINWEQAGTYCGWANRSLPSEAQWEKAARGTAGQTYPWGEQDPGREHANFGEMVKDTTAVGGYPAGASPYGALDMAGNVGEWTADWYHEYSYQNSATDNPIGSVSGVYRALRGGSWGSHAKYLHSAYRNWYFPVSSTNTYGFRCVYNNPG